MTTFPVNDVNEVQRKPVRAHYDRETVYAIVDEALVCQVGFVVDGQPYVIPSSHGRDGDTLYLHGAHVSRLLRVIAAGEPVCVSFTLLDGLVFARAAFSHSVHFRSAVLFGRGRKVDSYEEKLRALELITEQFAPGRWQEARPPRRAEVDATEVVAIQIERASAKTNSGGVHDSAEDESLPIWAGVVPLALRPGVPEPDPALSPATPLPASVERLLSR